MKPLLDLVRRHRAGGPVGIYSVCSAHPLVLRSALEHARATGGHALIEATSNQVNQDGGYTGLRPGAFRDLVWGMADEVGLPRDRVLLGGDHLGPNCWQAQPAEAALKRAGAMITEYVGEGFSKIHLDCSMSLSGDPHGLSDEVIAERTATLCALAEDAWHRRGGEPPVYVIGSEVPVPGGAQETLQDLAVTEPAAALATLAAHRKAFSKHGLDAAWERVIGLVVQPGVEFDHDAVVAYVPEKARRLSECLEGTPGLVFEAHSTDYQTPIRSQPWCTITSRSLKWARRSPLRCGKRSGRWIASSASGWERTRARACARRFLRPCAQTPRTGASTTTAPDTRSSCSSNTA